MPWTRAPTASSRPVRDERLAGTGADVIINSGTILLLARPDINTYGTVILLSRPIALATFERTPLSSEEGKTYRFLRTFT